MEFCVDESNLVYSRMGQISITGTLNQCLDSISDALLLPTYPTGSITNVNSTIILNNLISISELTSSTTLDFFLRLQWIDPRLSMPALWAKLSSQLNSGGVDITQALNMQNPNGTTVSQIWMPDVFFPDASEVDYSQQFVRLYPGGRILWSRHVTTTLMQSGFNYRKYPNDKQDIVVRFVSYGYVSTWLQQYSLSPPLSYFLNAEDVPSFECNPLWTHESNDYSVKVFDQYYSGIYKSEVVYSIGVARQPAGVVLRLALPILFLVILAGLTFWASTQDRFNSTSTFLLAISALSIVVVQTIPMVGYMTEFDKYSLAMFAMLFLCCVIHQFVCRLSQHEHLPFRMFSARTVEFLGRVFVIPLIFVVFYSSFSSSYQPGDITATAIAVTVFSAVVFVREVGGVRKSLEAFVAHVEQKTDSLDVTPLEVLVYNLYAHREFSWDLSKHIKRSAAKRSERKSTVVSIEMVDSPMNVSKTPSLSATPGSDSRQGDESVGVGVVVGIGVGVKKPASAVGRARSIGPTRSEEGDGDSDDEETGR